MVAQYDCIWLLSMVVYGCIVYKLEVLTGYDDNDKASAFKI